MKHAGTGLSSLAGSQREGLENVKSIPHGLLLRGATSKVTHSEQLVLGP